MSKYIIIVTGTIVFPLYYLFDGLEYGFRNPLKVYLEVIGD